MSGCESWTIKKAEYLRINAFEFCCWRRLWRVPWTARRSNQSIQRKSAMKTDWKDWCWNWSSHIFGHLMRRADSMEKTLMLGKIEDRRRRGRQRMRWLNGIDGFDGHEFGWTSGVGDGQGGLACCSSWGHKDSDTTERLNWTKLNWVFYRYIKWKMEEMYKVPCNLKLFDLCNSTYHNSI